MLKDYLTILIDERRGGKYEKARNMRRLCKRYMYRCWFSDPLCRDGSVHAINYLKMKKKNIFFVWMR